MSPHYSFGFGASPAVKAAVVTATRPQRQAEPAGPDEPMSFWEQYGGEIIVGTITATTSALAVYVAMRLVERRR